MKQKILVMDPDDLVRDSMSLFLEDLGCSVMTSYDAGGALSRLSEKKYNAVVCARHLPDMDGLEFLRHIRKLYPEMLKVLECDNNCNVEFINEARLAGANEIIHKPYTAKEVEKMMDRLHELTIQKIKSRRRI